jgi:AhpD family alkylhydroperoxidase
MPTNTFHKRIYTPSTFVGGMADLFRHLDDLVGAVRRKRISRAFAEKIMLAVTQVNDCRYCRYVHTRTALKVGVSPDELRQMLVYDFGALPAHEMTALAFARQYAEENGKPDAVAWQRLVDAYGSDRARDIVAYIRAITMGNLLGNTFDAFLSRWVGKPVQDSNPVSELLVLFLATIIVPLGAVLWLLTRPLRWLLPQRAGRLSRG